MYLTKKERKIHTQQKLIENLKEENQYLKEQLELYNPEKVKNKIALAEKSYKEYIKLTDELKELKSQYQKLLRDISEDKWKLKRRCKIK